VPQARDGERVVRSGARVNTACVYACRTRFWLRAIPWAATRSGECPPALFVLAGAPLRTLKPAPAPCPNVRGVRLARTPESPLLCDARSITKGIVSRVTMVRYGHATNSLLSIQIDAAINPGNSGGVQAFA
jgi:hypothetical protein